VHKPELERSEKEKPKHKPVTTQDRSSLVRYAGE